MRRGWRAARRRSASASCACAQVLQGALAARRRCAARGVARADLGAVGRLRCLLSSDVKHARAFFTAIAEQSASGNWHGADDLQILMTQLFAAPEAGDNPVQIMTIHHAKGLPI